jgi:hypothetical protein
VQWNWERCLPPRVPFSMLCPAGKKQVRTGAMELGKVLTPESRLLHVVPSRQDVDENRCNGSGKGAYPIQSPSPCCSQRERGRTSGKDLGKVLTWESRLLHVVPSEQEVMRTATVELRKVLSPKELPPPCCARLTRSG